MRDRVRVKWRREVKSSSSFINGSVASTIMNYMLGRRNAGVAWWYNEVVVKEEEGRLDLEECNRGLVLTNWDHYVGCKGWI